VWYRKGVHIQFSGRCNGVSIGSLIFYIVQSPLKAKIFLSKETSIIRLQHNKCHVSVAIVMYTMIEELWEVVFSVGPCRGYMWKIGTAKSVKSQVEVKLGGMQSETVPSMETSCTLARRP
jgi:hypothetical protein